MKILIRNFDSVVIYANNSLVLTAQGLTGDDWRDPNFTTANARLENATLPAGWQGAVWSYIAGVWAVVDTAAQSALLAEKAAADARVAALAKDVADAAIAKADAKVAAIGAMTPAQVKAWVTANVATLADAKDLITTLAVVISILARKL